MNSVPLAVEPLGWLFDQTSHVEVVSAAHYVVMRLQVGGHPLRMLLGLSKLSILPILAVLVPETGMHGGLGHHLFQEETVVPPVPLQN